MFADMGHFSRNSIKVCVNGESSVGGLGYICWHVHVPDWMQRYVCRHEALSMQFYHGICECAVINIRAGRGLLAYACA